ncbi:MurR/RpiR family transcriptional regulator [Sagittula salina]|uniref:MurR/RpiR family transcriptional regulator n=1 Tax=Sagittula salina TaxID=2820268 RepID=A0A940MLW6_9RHOB|nr:MurR/RpiR family transcriptional regulator [Sagittula salina]MBP0483896.1 MurR/RpiR family transcriptional regulator [Sagittula salina]
MATSEETVKRRLTTLAHTGPRKLATFARWVLDHFDEVAFLSIRGLTESAGVDANLAPRLAQSLGYDGYTQFRAEVQYFVQNRGKSYATRARALSGREGARIYRELIAANKQNFDTVTSRTNIAEIDSCVEILLTAHKVHTIGVRSCFSVAHYFSYVGAMAFENFVEVPSLPGGILDQISHVSPDDVLVAITYEHYSAEVVRACQIAREKGAQIIVLTDTESSPITLGAEKTIILPMSGPQLLPSLVGALLTVEMILAAMASRNTEVAERVGNFEERITRYGGYFGTDR